MRTAKTASSAAFFTFALATSMDESYLNRLIESIDKDLLPKLQLESIAPNDPVEVHHLPEPWQMIGAGNYAAVFSYPDYPSEVVKIYAPGRQGFEEELEVYRRLGSHPAFSECLYAGENFLVLKRLYGVTLYDCINQGVRIPVQVIRDIDRALDYARQRGLRPHDVHARNVMMHEGRGLVVDISDFLHEDACHKWDNLKRAYFWVYRPVMSPLRLRVPYKALDVVRKGYRFVSQRKRVAITIGVGIAIALVTTPIYIHSRRANGCVRYFPDGSHKTLYGKDCQR